MTPFSFQGEIPASKSLMNRALLIQSYFPQVEIKGNSNCDDVRHMKMAVVSFIQKKPIFCGDAGTVLRFMGMRCSRESGSYVLNGSERLFKRPHDDLAYLLEQLSVSCNIFSDRTEIVSQGWKKPLVPIQVRRQASSQFASSLLLNSWNLNFDLEFDMKPGLSEGYWEMSVQMALSLGMIIEKRGDLYRVPAKQTPHYYQMIMEPDYSCAFAVAAAGALRGQTLITNATAESIQPDFRFLKIMNSMGIKIIRGPQSVKIQAPEELQPVEVNLEHSPDLFPVLAVLCAFANGPSILRGAPHLVHKESNRIEKTAELLKSAGVKCTVKDDGIHIVGGGKNLAPTNFVFDPDQDHRMAMAAGLLKLKGFDIQIKNPQVINKSYPEFWKVIGLNS